MANRKIVLLALSAVLLASCADNSAVTDGEKGVKDFEIRIVEKSAEASYHCVGDTTYGADVRLYTTASVTLQWPEMLGNADIKCLQDTLLARCFGSESATLPVGEAMRRYVSDPVTMDDGAQLEAVDTVPVSDAYNVRTLAKSIKASAVSVGRRVAVFKVDWFMYGGGAHPIYASSFVNFDVERSRVLTLSEIVKPGNVAALATIVKNVLCEQYGVDSYEQLQANYSINAEAVDYSLQHPVFYIDGEYVAFYFNPYEIGPWATGAVEVQVPAFMLDDMLTPEAKILLGWQ